MSWRQLLDLDAQDFICANARGDIRTLALKNPPNKAWDYPLILEQIKVRQKASAKSPEWYETKGIIFPSGHFYEQCSSEACARYKASLVIGKSFVDLTAGTGIDAFYFSQKFDEGTCVERDAVNFDILEYNIGIFESVGKIKGRLSVVCEAAEDFIKDMPPVDFIYIDPQRRDNKKSRFYRLFDCSPNVEGVISSLGSKVLKVMVKTSPLLDIHRTIETLGCVSEVHVVAWRGECKEVLYILSLGGEGQGRQRRGGEAHDPLIVAVEIDDAGRVLNKLEFRYSEERAAENTYVMPQQYIYEPGPAFQKAGGSETIAAHFGVNKLHRHTHLYTSHKAVENFPGKLFKLEDVIPVRSKGLKLRKADLAIRNFPGTVADLRRKLKLSEGGDHKIFACTLVDNQKRLLICKKIEASYIKDI